MIDWNKPLRTKGGRDAATLIGTRPDGVRIVALQDSDGTWDHFEYREDGSFRPDGVSSHLDLENSSPAPRDFTLRRFHNALRILHSLDLHELRDAGPFSEDEWESFRDHPYHFLIRCSDANADIIWTALMRRNP